MCIQGAANERQQSGGEEKRPPAEARQDGHKTNLEQDKEPRRRAESPQRHDGEEASATIASERKRATKGGKARAGGGNPKDIGRETEESANEDATDDGKAEEAKTKERDKKIEELTRH